MPQRRAQAAPPKEAEKRERCGTNNMETIIGPAEDGTPPRRPPPAPGSEVAEAPASFPMREVASSLPATRSVGRAVLLNLESHMRENVPSFKGDSASLVGRWCSVSLTTSRLNAPGCTTQFRTVPPAVGAYATARPAVCQRSNQHSAGVARQIGRQWLWLAAGRDFKYRLTLHPLTGRFH